MRRAPQPLLLDLVFAALSDATRRGLLTRLIEGEATVGALAEPLQMSLPAVSKHLRVLEDAGLLKRRIEGRTHYITANPKPLREAVNWIERHRQMWEGSFDRLAALVEQAPPEPPAQEQTKPKKS
ncbi:MAG: metalloregulator ArsR/SmtB family transcription factor [Prosthecobacter sp.]|uniref:ArsR/SmtB family transcription factor n=1 Tax=Prosthecobacter sp. TaxID=1965333 RepID=UPI003BB1479E